MRGELSKRENRRELEIERGFLTRNYSLHLNKRLCNGCGLCAEICPKEAIGELSASIVEGRLAKKPKIEFDINSCILCGECAVLCPLNALKMKVDEKEISTIVKNEAFPVFIKEIKITKEKCKPDCELKCQEECPTEAIKVSTKSSEDGKTLEIIDVELDESICFYCKRCELFCPQNAIEVKKPFYGTVELNVDLCPDNCMACIDICPTHALQAKEGKPMISPEFCIFCFACQKVCPKEAIKTDREWVFHADIKAAAWLTALKKLTSTETVAKELMIKSGKKRKLVTGKRLT
ncbi:MAG: 4Fe-4S binding protein [Candidatus Bathyarchaeota archaeon]|nr:MAG: 4Fe-4S binding protein [Candidatus Bathyarchaeota archaeon]